MAKNLRVFGTLAEYEAAKDAHTLVCPNVSYIKNPSQVKYLQTNPPIGIGIAALADGVRVFYTPAQWEALETKPTVMGVYVKTPDTGFIIHPTAAASNKWSSNNTVNIQGVVTTTKSGNAILDFAGKDNTDAILAAVENGVIEDAPAATWADSQTFADGTHGFLWAAGQLEIARINGVVVNNCIEMVGGAKINFGSNLWSSTQHSAANAWYWFSTNWHYNTKTSSPACRACCLI